MTPLANLHDKNRVVYAALQCQNRRFCKNNDSPAVGILSKTPLVHEEIVSQHHRHGGQHTSHEERHAHFEAWAFNDQHQS